MWGFLLGPSGHGKSTAVYRAVEFHREVLKRIDPDENDPYVEAEGSIPGIYAAITDRFDSETKQTAAVLYQDELSRTIDQKDTVAEMLCALADGRAKKRNLIGARQAEREGRDVGAELKNPVVSALFATTRSNLRRVAKPHHLEGGLFSRMLWFSGKTDPSRLKLHPSTQPTERGVAVSVWEEFASWCNARECTSSSKVVSIGSEVDQILRESLFEQLRTSMENDDDRLNPSRRRGLVQGPASLQGSTPSHNVEWL